MKNIQFSRDSNKINIFITDVASGEFINAREAWYDTNSRTPMDYGFGAYKDKNGINKSKKLLILKRQGLVTNIGKKK